jgi:hypothetical protein
MHDFLIAAVFLSIVLSPCIAALWNRSDPAFPRARRFNPGLVIPGDPVRGESHTQSIEMVRCARSDRFRMLHKHELSVLTQQAAIPSATTQN